jgi:adenylate kinase family enzyme
MRKTKLIVLRGPSGSGKSTSAKALFEMATNPIALIDQDHYRFIFKPAGGGSKANSDTIHKMIKGDVLIALNDGYDVILEGILSVKSYGGLLDGIFAAHKGENYMYYFDISFEETVRRYHTKPDAKKKEFSEEDMRQWYPAAHRSNHTLERIIPESHSLDETVAYILDTSKLLPD